MHNCHMLDYLHICKRIHQTGAGTELNTCTKQWSMFRNTTDMQHTIPLTNSAIYTQQCISTLSQGIHTHPTHVHTHTLQHTHALTCTHMHQHRCTCTHTVPHSLAHMCTCPHMLTYIHAYTCTHTRTLIFAMDTCKGLLRHVMCCEQHPVAAH